MLGPVLVNNAAQVFHRTAAKELVVYLACRRGGASNGEWAEALWPTRPVSPGTVHSTASDARRALGPGVDGVPLLRRSDGRLVLGESVTTDARRFGELAASVEPGDWLRAMGLVRGVPFSGLRSGDWAVFEGVKARVERMVSTAAQRICAQLITENRGDDAEWVVRQGLIACPYDELLYRSLLRATAAQGNRVGLRAAMVHVLTLAGESERAMWGPPRHRTAVPPLTQLDPDTVCLYRDLLGGRPAAGGAPARL